VILFSQQFIDLVVQISEAMFPEAGVLDLGYLLGDFL